MTMDGKNGPDDQHIRSEYDAICQSLNMDKETAQTAWQRYQDIQLKFTLEVRHQSIVLPHVLLTCLAK